MAIAQTMDNSTTTTQMNSPTSMTSGTNAGTTTTDTGMTPGNNPTTTGMAGKNLTNTAGTVNKDGSGDTVRNSMMTTDSNTSVKNADYANTGSDAIKTNKATRGHNSFTEKQAMKRLTKNGYSEVSGLAKDANSIWRGTAMKDGRTVGVALDYKGHITETASQ